MLERHVTAALLLYIYGPTYSPCCLPQDVSFCIAALAYIFCVECSDELGSLSHSILRPSVEYRLAEQRCEAAPVRPGGIVLRICR